MSRKATHLSEEHLALLATEEPDPVAASHLAACEQCRTRWEEYRRISAALRALPRPQVPRDFVVEPRSVAVLAHVPWWWRYQRVARVGTVLAATLLVILLATTALLPSPGTGTPEQYAAAPPAPAAEFRAAAAETPEMGGPEEATLPSVQTFATEPTPAVSAAADAQLPVTQGTGEPAPSDSEFSLDLGTIGRFVLYGAIGLLGLLTLAGLVIGFLLPALRRNLGSVRL